MKIKRNFFFGKEISKFMKFFLTLFISNIDPLAENKNNTTINPYSNSKIRQENNKFNR